MVSEHNLLTATRFRLPQGVLSLRGGGGGAGGEGVIGEIWTSALGRGGDSSGLVIERSRVRIPAGTAGEFSSPGSTFCADSYFGIRSTPVLPQ